MKKDSLIEEYKNYNPEKDPSGAYGISLANQIEQKYGSVENIPNFVSIQKAVMLNEIRQKIRENPKGSDFYLNNIKQGLKESIERDNQ